MDEGVVKEKKEGAFCVWTMEEIRRELSEPIPGKVLRPNHHKIYAPRIRSAISIFINMFIGY